MRISTMTIHKWWLRESSMKLSPSTTQLTTLKEVRRSSPACLTISKNNSMLSSRMKMPRTLRSMLPTRMTTRLTFNSRPWFRSNLTPRRPSWCSWRTPSRSKKTKLLINSKRFSDIAASLAWRERCFPRSRQRLFKILQILKLKTIIILTTIRTWTWLT